MTYLKDIISEIEKESCVLVLGPDLQELEGKSLFEVLSNELSADNQYNQLVDVSPQHIFAHEELLQLKPATKETTILRFMERFYQKQTQLDIPFAKISQIPFHLIISLMPDERLKKVFEAQHLAFQYSHYPREENPKPVEKPNKDVPLIYNLLGDFGEGDVIFTFDHLFTYLSGIMGKRELPQALQETLKKARTFVFLGVHFERWYCQLLLRIITSTGKTEKYTLLKNGNTNAACTFVARRLELDFIETDPLDFLSQLYQECGERDLLRTATTKYRASVFISYSHKDKEVAELIEKKLNAERIQVIRDENSMLIGQKVTDFIDVISKVDCFLSVVSENSLLSTWVSKETVLALKQPNQYILPCYLDESFLDKEFYVRAKDLANENLAEITTKIGQRGMSPINDLLSDRADWTELYTNLNNTIAELKKRKYVSLMEPDFENNMTLVVAHILKHKEDVGAATN